MPSRNRDCRLAPSAPGRLPSVDSVLRSPEGVVLVGSFGHQATVAAVRRILAELREKLSSVDVSPQDPAIIAAHARAALEKGARSSLRRVFNLTGTVLHTNLGRAVLAETAIEAAVKAMRHAVALEYDVESGGRGERDDVVRDLIRELTGAEDAVIVNNNAAAVLLALNTLAEGRDAIVSRGELIEIGGAFRLPDIMKRAGCQLVEVGTTNRTHARDYQEAIGSDTGVVLKAHTSNYVIQGFTSAVPPAELSGIAKARGVPFIHDLGSGALIDLSSFGLRPEPTVRQALEEGADLVTFSGDKLLGGPQIGIVAGRRELVRRVAKNPMKRALRADKIRLAVLEATLSLYRDPDRLAQTLPTFRLLARSQQEMATIAIRLKPTLARLVGAAFRVDITDCSSQVGSGAAPVDALPSVGIAIASIERRGTGGRLQALAAAFRQLPIPVIGRINEDRFLLDLRCLDDEAAFVAQLGQLDLGSSESGCAG